MGLPLLTGTSGLGRALPLPTQLRGVLGGPLGGIGGWRVLFVGITSGAGRFAALLGVVAGGFVVQAGLARCGWSAGCSLHRRRTDFTGARYRNTGAQTVRSARTVGMVSGAVGALAGRWVFC